MKRSLLTLLFTSIIITGQNSQSSQGVYVVKSKAAIGTDVGTIETNAPVKLANCQFSESTGYSDSPEALLLSLSADRSSTSFDNLSVWATSANAKIIQSSDLPLKEGFSRSEESVDHGVKYKTEVKYSGGFLKVNVQSNDIQMGYTGSDYGSIQIDPMLKQARSAQGTSITKRSDGSTFMKTSVNCRF